MTKTYHGSCHCGRVRYEAEIDLAAGTGKCNCSICWKMRFWGATVKPEAFRLTAGEDALADYQFNSNSCHHRFCTHCGVHPFGHGYIEEAGGAFYSINLSCLDDAEPRELAEAQVRYYDGRHNNWMETPAEIRHL